MSDHLGLDRKVFHRVDVDYDPFKNGDFIGYEEFADHLMQAHNPIAFAAIKADINREDLSLRVIDLEQSCWF